MRNRFMIYRKGHSVASALLFVLLIAHLLLPLLAWLGSAAGFPLGNLFSSEGIRWYYLHIQDWYCQYINHHYRILLSYVQ